MMQYKNMNVKFHSPGGHTDYFDIVADVLQGDTLAPYLFIIYLDYMILASLDLMQESGFTLVKARSRRYPAQMITNVDYGDDIELMANTPALPQSLLHNLEKVAGCIGRHVNADKIEFICFNRRGDISIQYGGPLKLVGMFTYLGSKVSSTKIDINTQLAKAWTAINGLSVIWKSDLIDKIKRFSQAAV